MGDIWGQRMVIRRALEKAGILMVSAEVTMIPQNYVDLTDETAVKNLQKTLDLLEHSPGCQHCPVLW